jgi:hypothetical protein
MATQSNEARFLGPPAMPFALLNCSRINTYEKGDECLSGFHFSGIRATATSSGSF